MKEEIERIINLFSSVDDIEIENDIEEIKNTGFIDKNDYLLIKSIKNKFDTFMQYVQDWDGLEERKQTIKRTIVAINLLRNNGTNV